MKNIIFLLLFLIFISGCTTQNQQLFQCTSGDWVSNPSLCPNSATQENKTNIETQKEICPYNCCDSEKYDLKGCPGGFYCQNNTCVQNSCPFDCCDGITYQLKNCPSTMECVANQCLKKSCPFDCCDDGGEYIAKNCSINYQCANNKCLEIPIPKLTLTIDECVTSQNFTKGLGEVTDLYVTLSNFGTKEALNVSINGTANDVESVMAESYGTIVAIPPGLSAKLKVVVDTDSSTQTTAKVNVSCASCTPSELSIETPNCHYNPEKILDTASTYVAIAGKLVAIFP